MSASKRQLLKFAQRLELPDCSCPLKWQKLPIGDELYWLLPCRHVQDVRRLLRNDPQRFLEPAEWADLLLSLFPEYADQAPPPDVSTPFTFERLAPESNLDDAKTWLMEEVSVDVGPTPALPGSSGKVAVLEARAAAGLSLWHTDDAKMKQAKGIGARGKRGRNGAPSRDGIIVERGAA